MFGASVMRGGMRVDVIRACRTSQPPRGWPFDRTVGMSRDSWVIQVKSSRVGNRNGGIIRMTMERIIVY
eukprot:1781160-Pyramimonas_sp.AAC.1